MLLPLLSMLLVAAQAQVSLYCVCLSPSIHVAKTRYEPALPPTETFRVCCNGLCRNLRLDQGSAPSRPLSMPGARKFCPLAFKLTRVQAGCFQRWAIISSL